MNRFWRNPRARAALTGRPERANGSRGCLGARARPGAPLAVDLPLESAGGRELRSLARLDLDRLAGRGVAAFAGCALGDAELAEPGNRHLTACGELSRDRIEHRIDRPAGLANANPGALRNLASELVLRHDAPLRWADTGAKTSATVGCSGVSSHDRRSNLGSFAHPSRLRAAGAG